jgi:uncharacterized protein (TIGR00661 family)
MGHATRSRVLLEELVKRHEVHIVVSGRAQEYLAKRFQNVHNIWGLSIHYEDNAVRNLQTVLHNVKGALSGWPKNIRTYFELMEKFRPDVVISDFESFSFLFGRNHFIPVISVDNIQIINRCEHDPSLLAGHEDSFEFTRAFVKSKLPGCFHYIISTFFFPKVRKERTTLVPPILRPEIIAAKAEPGEHLLVYQTSTSNLALPEILKATRMPCRIYGLRRDNSEDVVDDNLVYRPFSEAGFIDDLRTARAVVAGGGFTVLSEAVYLRKPVLSQPVEKQFEQVLNALYVEKLGYGMYARALTPEAVQSFLARLPECEKALADYHQDGNVRTLATLDEKLAGAAERKGAWSEITRS